MTHSITNTQHNNALHCAERCYSECDILFIVMLSVITLNVIILSVVMLNAIMLSVIAPGLSPFPARQGYKDSQGFLLTFLAP